MRAHPLEQEGLPGGGLHRVGGGGGQRKVAGANAAGREGGGRRPAGAPVSGCVAQSRAQGATLAREGGGRLRWGAAVLLKERQACQCMCPHSRRATRPGWLTHKGLLEPPLVP